MQKKIMKLKRIKQVFLCLSLILCLLLSGCSSVHQMQVKLGIKNNDFEYIKNDKIQKIVIQSTRDEGFRFVLQDQQAIEELYDILSDAKPVKNKSSLKPDYVFEIYQGSKVHKFNYIAELDKKDTGNLYGDNKVYAVSKRIDTSVIQNFWTIREPKDFQNVYYKSIIMALDDYIKSQKKQGKSVGVNLDDDVEVAKYILSNDLEGFKDDLNSKFKNTKVVSAADKDKYTILATVKTEGYKLTLYKGTVTFYDREDKSEKKYYIFDKYENARWDIKVTDSKPDGF
ncbi:hypothetical protein [Clostridium sp. JN-1]|uniref:hypothetical protein n=1 Tax=Clostridium sp. JN-1 TaxID=2483110 RepID=UPI001FAB0410|nr:hypothetical protein [Clostridium sp. JN-1]